MSLVVLYDQGAVSPTDILRIGRARKIIVVLASSAHAQRMRPLFTESCSAVYDLADEDLLTRLRECRPDGIVTFSEAMLAVTSRLSAALRLRYHDANVVELLTSKDAQRRQLRSGGVDQTRSVMMSSADQWDAAVASVGLPAVVKPVQGVSSRNTVLVHDIEAGRARLGPLLSSEGQVLVEEYLRGVDVPGPLGDYVSVETVVQNEERHHLPVTGKLLLAPPFRECGQFWPARLDMATCDGVTELADRAVKTLGVSSGILHTEIKLTPAGPRIIEVNGRVGGYIPELVGRAAPIDLVEIGARIACGEQIAIPPIRLDRVLCQFNTPAPVRHGVVSAVCKGDVLTDVPGVVHYYSFAQSGMEVGGIRTHELDLVAIETADHESLVSVLNTIMDRITYRFEFDGEETVLSARELVYHTPTEGEIRGW